jgi:hypothetical protein
LLDLVSGEWLERLAVEIAARRLPFYAALTYDGEATMTPPDPFDGAVVDAVNRHQRRDKGFGPALGPTAPARAIAAFAAAGYAVVQGRSDWRFSVDDRDIQGEIFAGWGAAAQEIGLPASDLAAWLHRRRSALATAEATLRVGHVDFFARPMGTR